MALLWSLSAALAVAGCLGLLLYSLLQPSAFPNSGLAAYTPPPGTRLLPLPRKSDAPELAALASQEEPTPLGARAQGERDDIRTPKRNAERPVRKRSHPPVRHREPREQYARQWNNGWRSDWRSNSWSGSSGPWF